MKYIILFLLFTSVLSYCPYIPKRICSEETFVDDSIHIGRLNGKCDCTPKSKYAIVYTNSSGRLEINTQMFVHNRTYFEDYVVIKDDLIVYGKVLNSTGGSICGCGKTCKCNNKEIIDKICHSRHVDCPSLKGKNGRNGTNCIIIDNSIIEVFGPKQQTIQVYVPSYPVTVNISEDCKKADSTRLEFISGRCISQGNPNAYCKIHCTGIDNILSCTIVNLQNQPIRKIVIDYYQLCGMDSDNCSSIVCGDDVTVLCNTTQDCLCNETSIEERVIEEICTGKQTCPALKVNCTCNETSIEERVIDEICTGKQTCPGLDQNCTCCNFNPIEHVTNKTLILTFAQDINIPPKSNGTILTAPCISTTINLTAISASCSYNGGIPLIRPCTNDFIPVPGQNRFIIQNSQFETLEDIISLLYERICLIGTWTEQSCGNQTITVLDAKDIPFLNEQLNVIEYPIMNHVLSEITAEGRIELLIEECSDLEKIYTTLIIIKEDTEIIPVIVENCILIVDVEGSYTIPRQRLNI